MRLLHNVSFSKLLMPYLKQAVEMQDSRDRKIAA